MNLLQDIKTAVNVFGEVRKARKNGAGVVRIKQVCVVPMLKFCYWGGTMESCLFYGPKWQPLRDVFDSLPGETQHALTFSPKAGEWVSRVRFWQRELSSILEPDLYHEMISTLIRWCIKCRRRELAEARP